MLSGHHRLQSSRFELKYIIDEPCAIAVRKFIACYLVPDEHADPRNNYEYPVYSLYLDSPNYTLYRATVTGLTNRFKLRVRFYNQLPDSPAFFEIKERRNEVILKQRAAVRRSSVTRLLAGHWPRLADLVDSSTGDFGRLQRFCGLRDRLQAGGKVFLSYMREAHVSEEDESIRVTFDRQLAASRCSGLSGMQDLKLRRIPVGNVILELKFTNRFPIWLRHMVRIFSLERISVAKYVSCAQALGDPQLRMVDSYQEYIA
jgi:hypothetical protein